MLTSVATYEVEPVAGGAFMHLQRDGHRRLGMRLSNEATIASIASISRQVSDVAGHLCMSARTLQRRLADGGHSYQSLVDEARRRLSERLLAETDYSLSEISFMAGFSDQSAFTRAFSRWAGQTPRSYRFQAQSSAG